MQCLSARGSSLLSFAKQENLPSKISAQYLREIGPEDTDTVTDALLSSSDASSGLLILPWARLYAQVKPL